MLKHTLFIGLNDKDSLKQEIQTDKACDIIHDVVGDCSIQEGMTGFYTMDNGITVKEKSLQVAIFGQSKKKVVLYCKQLKQLLNQESIILQTEQVNSVFI